MAEVLTLTAAIVPPSRTTYRVRRMNLDVDALVIQAWVVGSDGSEQLIEWLNAGALLLALNTANLSVKSLQRRVLEQAVTDSKLTAGTVSGTPS